MKTISQTLLLTAAVLALGTGAAVSEDYTSPSNGTDGGMNSSSAGSMNDMGSQASDPQDQNSISDDQSTQSSAPQTSAQSSANASAQLSNSDIQEAQDALRSKGYSVSSDGVLGPQTIAAIREFQGDSNLSATGQLDSQTLAALDIDNVTTPK